jgi:SAM-dependent methyltransferase
MNDNNQKWIQHYKNTEDTRHYYPENFLVRLLTSKFPSQVVNNMDYAGQKVLDLSCGHGRNLKLLENLGFDCHATEISREIVKTLEHKFKNIVFGIGTANNIPFVSNFFDGVVACNSCYYLEDDNQFSDNLKEISRILKPGAWFIGTVLKDDHTAISGSSNKNNNIVTITNDRLDIRNGTQMQFASTEEDVIKHLDPFFNDITIGLFTDKLLDFNRSFFYFYCHKRTSI